MDDDDDTSNTQTSATGSAQDSMSEGAKSSSDDAEDDLDDLEDLKKLIVSETLPEETKEDEPGDDEIDSKPEDFEFKVTDEDLDEEERLRLELLQKEKEASLSAKEEELKKEEERRDKMKVLLSGYLELKAKKEIEKALLNEKKIIAQWLYPFREAYQKEWQLELTKLKLAFQKALDFKKAHIHAIQRERKLCELNHLWADCAHYQVSEELFEFMRKRCEELKAKYLEELEETKRYYLEREQQILEKCSKAEERARLLEDMRRDIRESVLKQTNEALETYRRQGEFLREKEEELVQAEHATNVERIARELQAAVSPPEHKMDELRATFSEWKEKYDAFSQVFARNQKEIQAVSGEIPDLERRVAAARRKLAEIRKDARRQQQLQMEEILQLQKEQRRHEQLGPAMRKCISDSERVMEQLRERKAKLEKIRKLKGFCDQLESESDRISKDVPFLDPEEQRDLDQADCAAFIRDLCSEDFEDPHLMENLNRKVSRARLQIQVLRHDLEKLKVENKALKSDMKKYLGKISSGEWQQLPGGQEVGEGEGMKDGARGEVKGQSPGGDRDVYLRMNLELLRKKCHSVNSKIVDQAEKKFGNIK